MSEARMYDPKLTEKQIARFRAKIEIDPVTGCHNWTRRLENGYGSLNVHKRTHLAHRLAYVLAYGAIPAGNGSRIKQVHHKCKNRACCNPAHLELVFPKKNLEESGATSNFWHNRPNCRKGHAWTEENTIYVRVCRCCYNEAQRQTSKKRRAASKQTIIN